MLRKKIAAAFLAAGTAFGLITTGATEASAQDLPALITSPNVTTCSSEFLITIPGGGNTFTFLPEKAPVGAKVTEVATGVYHRSGRKVQPVWITYPAVPFMLMSYNDSSRAGYDKAFSTTQRLARMCPDARFSFTGYSEGADVGTKLINAIAQGRGPIPAEKVRASVFISNPHLGDNGGHFAFGATHNDRGALESLDGGYGELGERTLDICFKDDPVCALPEEWRTQVSPFLRVATLRGQFPVTESLAIIARRSPTTLPLVISMYNHTKYGPDTFRAGTDWILNH